MSIPFSTVPTWDDRTPIYVISVAAQLAGMHPQTLRQYDRLGLVTPIRATGRGRRYSAYDVARLCSPMEISRCSDGKVFSRQTQIRRPTGRLIRFNPPDFRPHQ